MSELENGSAEAFQDDVEMKDAAVAVVEADEAFELDTDVSDAADALLESVE
jgi:hypothetical protein